MKPIASLPASRSGKSISKVLVALRGRYRATMLESWAGERMNPFQHVIGTILSARCRDEVTDVVSRKLFAAYPTPEKLAAAPKAAVQRIIRSIGFYRMKAKYVIETSRRIVQDHGGTVPDTFEELTAFPGVGRKVANCVLVYAFGKPAIAVDTHVHRVSNRLGWVRTKSPDKTERELEKILPRPHWLEINELLVAHGKAVCRPIGPRCSDCEVADYCARVGVTTRSTRVASSQAGHTPD